MTDLEKKLEIDSERSSLMLNYLEVMEKWSIQDLRQFQSLFEAYDTAINSPQSDETERRGAAFWFTVSWNHLAQFVHENAQAKGFWAEGLGRNKAELIALMHSELSEALEAIRHNNPPDDHIPQFTAVEAELGDVVIRIMDAAYIFGWDVPGAAIAKMLYNPTRPDKHGKTF